MEEIYAILIIKGKKTIDNVPEQIRNEVEKILIEKGYTELAKGDD